jgi:hypothetical protein
MVIHLYLLTVVATLLPSLSLSREVKPPLNENKIRAAIVRPLLSLGYEVTERRTGSDNEVVELEYRDSDAYNPSNRMLLRLRSLRPWAKSTSTYFRYWLVRETYDSQEEAEKRVKEYMVDYHERLATAKKSSHMVSKTILRVDARRRGTTVYLLVTDGAYTANDDKKQERILDTIVNGKNT